MNSILPSTGKTNRLSLFQITILVVVCLVGFGIRMYHLKDPPLDFHPTRQLRSALISRSVYYQLNPAADPAKRKLASDLSSLEIYEPPILEQLVGLIYLIMGTEAVWVARIVNAIFWVIGGLALQDLLRRVLSFEAAVFGLAFYFCLPFSVIASRSFQPEPWMVMWILLAAWALYRWTEQPSWKWAIAAGVLGGIAVVVKVVAAFFVGLMLVGAVLAALGLRRLFRSAQPWVMAAFILVPSGIFYLGFNPQRSGDFLSFWTVSLGGMIFTTTFYAQWLAMVKGLMGLTYPLLALVGILLAEKRIRLILIGAWIGYLLYGLIFPYQYITHEYYHLPLVGLVALSVPFALDPLVRVLRQQFWLWQAGVVLVLCFAAFYSLYVARSTIYASNTPSEPASWARVGKALPPGKPFVALTADYGMRLRYYGWRTAGAYWPSSADLKLTSLAGGGKMDPQAEFKQIISGKDYFLVTALGEFEAQPVLKEILTTDYPVYYQGNGFVIYDLVHPLAQSAK